MKFKYIGLIAIAVLFFWACSENVPVPKPYAYLRIELPEKSYQAFDTLSYPYSFEYPVYAKLEYPSANEAGGKYFLNIDFPVLNSIIFISYKQMKGEGDLIHYTDSCTRFIDMHQQKSSGVLEKSYIDTENKVYATVFRIKGAEVATPYQFWITDSIKHFFRGAFYSKATPNNEKMAPVIDFVGQDIDHLISTFRWR